MTEREIVLAALDRDDPAERAKYLDQACAGDTTLRQRIEAMLLSRQETGDFLKGQTPATTSGAPSSHVGARRSEADDQTLDYLAPSQKPGPLGRLDHYEMLAVIGRGGMSAVLKAARFWAKSTPGVSVPAAEGSFDLAALPLGLAYCSQT
jgi:hypothetical protein